MIVVRELRAHLPVLKISRITGIPRSSIYYRKREHK
jgi:hypothetical protein